MNPRPRPLRSTASLSLSLILGLAASTTAMADDVALVPNSTYKAPGNRVKGTIQSESPAEVKIQPASGAAQTIPVDQISTVTYDSLPASFPLAEQRENAGNLTEAAKLYLDASTAATDKPFIARAAQFNRARILAQLAQADPKRSTEAIAALEDFARKNAGGRQITPALDLLVQLCLRKGDFDRADKALTDMAKIPWAADRAAVMKARVLTRRGKFDEALGKLNPMLASAPEGSTKGRDARLAKAEALAGLRKYDEAEALSKEVIKAAPAEDVESQAVAHNTLGDCLRAAGKPKDALVAYLHTDLLYSRDKEQHPKALAQIAQLWRELKRDDRADEAMERLKQEYPSSSWLSTPGGSR